MFHILRFVNNIKKNRQFLNMKNVYIYVRENSTLDKGKIKNNL